MIHHKTEADNYIEYVRTTSPNTVVADPRHHGALMIAILETEDPHSSVSYMYQFPDLSCVKVETGIRPPKKIGSKVTLTGRIRSGNLHQEDWVEIPKM